MTLPLEHPIVRPNRGGRKPDEPRPGWRARLQALRHVPRLLRLVWRTEPRYVAGILVLRVAPVAGAAGGALDRQAHRGRGGARRSAWQQAGGAGVDWTRLGELLALELAIALVGEGLARVSALLESLLGDLFANQTSVELMRHAATLDLEQFEDAEIYDKLERARRQTVGRIGLFTLLLATVQDAITLVTLAAALAVYVPWLLVLLVVAVLPSLLGETHFASLGYSLLYSWTPERRQLDYLRYIGASDISAKELKLFGLSDFLVGPLRPAEPRVLRGQQAAGGAAEPGLHPARRRSARWATTAAYAVIIYLTVIGLPLAGRAVHHRRAHLPGGLVPPEPGPDPAGAALAVAGVRAEPLPGRPVHLPRRSSRASAASPAGGRCRCRSGPGSSSRTWGSAIPGSERWAVRGLDFSLAPGERLALVGENGAGKTTLVKLLARLYDPTEGRILLDGVDLREYDVESLRRNVGVIFQDFVRYDFMLKENIAVGNIGAREDEPRIETAAAAEPGRHGGRRGWPAGTTRCWAGGSSSGVELSGGEWQKVALARAYMRDAQLLILDEPTAALDARAEYEVFLRFSELTAGRMAVLISHRFSTVRMADRILVLRGGELVEQGTHEALVAQGGLYAELFQLQAAGYR